MQKFLMLFVAWFCFATLKAQDTKLVLAKYAHPRLIVADNAKQKILQKIQSDTEAANVINKQRSEIEVYVNRHQTDSTWITSRLQMYWKSKSTEVFIRAGVYDHAEGEAPVPTVKFPGTRDNVSVYTAPKLEDIQPYMDDPKGVYLVNKSKLGQPLEWAEISKTGRIIESINTSIMQKAYTAAVLYYLFGDDKYAKFAADLFDTYMTGMQYRKEPFDLTHGHHQTLAGLSTFEVIQEVAMLNNLTGVYDFLYDYLAKNKSGKMTVYADVFRKWADVQIAHGVAFNNWNLMQAKNVLNIALMLDDDKSYTDGKGNQYYTNYILNTDSERQWSLKKVLNLGYDSVTGMWNESPGYSKGVLEDFIGYVTFFDRYYHYDLVAKMPLLKKAVLTIAQYLFPDGNAASFGDSHYGRINTHAAYELVANADRNNKPDQEKIFTRYIKTIDQFNKQTGDKQGEGKHGNSSLNELLFTDENGKLKDNVSAGDIQDYATPVFYSANVSYLALRNGFDKENGLMVAMSGSKGNHMHAGGISMELYGKGLMLGPESGIGTSYFQQDYAEYYSQFPAHNTVLVDGISAYPVMKSNHGFELKSSYPKSEQKDSFFSSVSFAEMAFVEPETMSDQNRLTSIIRTSDSTGYYVDIFRSKRRDGKDKMHDYIYHNMGQQVMLNDNDSRPFSLQASEKLSFGGGHLFGYDYFYDKKAIATDKDINAVFSLEIPGKKSVQMNLWMKGEKDREIFALKAPKSTAIDRIGLPKEIAELPLPTILARQSGEAWTKPFAVVFEPSTITHPKSLINITSFNAENVALDFIGLKVESKSGCTQYIFSSTQAGREITYIDKKLTGTYAVIGEESNRLQYLLLGNGSSISKGGYSIIIKNGNAAAALENKDGGWFFTCEKPAILCMPRTALKDKTKLTIAGRAVIGKKGIVNKINVVFFDMPTTVFSRIIF